MSGQTNREGKYTVSSHQAQLRMAARIKEQLEELQNALQTSVGDSQVDLMGVWEVSQALGISQSLVSTWNARGKMPTPIAVLKSGPIWTRRQIEPLLRMKREGEKEGMRQPG